MDERVENFIKQNINLIQNQNWEEVYNKEFPDGFTETLLDCGINPLEQGLNYIPDYFLCECETIKNFTIPDNITSIGDSAFSSCDSLTSIVIPNSVTSIGRRAFYGCTSLIEIKYNAINCEDLNFNNYVFGKVGNNGSGIKLIIGSNVKKIPMNLFYINNSYSPKIVEIMFEEDSVCESIGASAFSNCFNLTSVTIGNSVTSIGRCAFFNCNNLTSVVIGNSVTSIGDRAFYGCSSLTNVVIPNSVTSIDNLAFKACEKLTYVKYLGTKREAIKLGIGDKSKEIWRRNSAIEKIICTDGVIEL